MKRFLAGILKKMSEPRYERLLVVLLPCIALAICAFILMPQVKLYLANRAAAIEALSAAPADDKNSQPDELTDAYLSVYSEGEDLLISVCDENGAPIEGERFQLTLTAPNGDEIICATYTDGRCYLVELIPGLYTVTMSPHEGYKTPGSVECAVSSLTHEAPSLEQLVPGLNSVDGRLYYLGADGRIASAVGLDLSCYNGRIEWEALREQGVGFVILRAGGRGWGTGRLYTDTRFREYLLAAKSAGLKLGVYFYSTAVNVQEAVAEAEYTLSLLEGAPLEMPIFIDTEYSGSYPNGRADKLSRAQRAAIINAFARTVESRGYSTGFYSGTYYIGQELDYPSVSRHCVWIANYTRNNALPSVNYRYDIWQYTESGRIRGIYGPVDVNVMF